MHLGRLTLAALCLVLTASLGASLQETPKKENWISLFNGKNLEGWTPKFTGYDPGENYGNTFRVENGVLKVVYDKEKYPQFNGRFGHLFYKQKYSSYRLRIEYRFVGEQVTGGPGWALRNSGVMIHSQSPASMRKDQEFPVSLEVQFLGGNGKDKRSTGNLCTPGTLIVRDGKLITDHCIDSTSKTFHGDQWVTAEAEVHSNGTILHKINGETVIQYEQPQLDEKDSDAKKLIQNGDRMLKEGYIALQAESHPVEFRKVEILPLDK
jgi:hypothetical protein